jgi:hypothetical protein
MQKHFGKGEMFGALTDLGWSFYAAWFNYQTGYFYWNTGYYMGRAIADTYIVLDWCVNFSQLQPYWALAL